MIGERRENKKIDWGEIEWKEINWKGYESDADNIDWSAVQWREFQSEDPEYISGVDWGEVDWVEANFKNIKVLCKVRFSKITKLCVVQHLTAL